MVTTPDAKVEDITFFFRNDAGIQVSILRLDQLDPVVSGNKWFKLKYNLEAAVAAGFKQIITFGGAYSNHLIATAAAASASGLKAIGVVRGLHAQSNLTPTLNACIRHNMQLHFVSRGAYATKEEPAFLDTLMDHFGPSFFIPEGGDNDLGRLGAGDIVTLIPDRTTHICVPVGTGTTLAGIRNQLPITQQMIGFTAMKGGDYLNNEIGETIPPPQNKNWHLQTGYAFNGFAKTTPELIDFIQGFYRTTNIPLDIVYTGKMMYGLQDMISKNRFPAHANILCIHTGGLQGNPRNLFDR